MTRTPCACIAVLGALALFFGSDRLYGQASATVEGQVTDPSGAAVSGATVEISYPVSGYRRQTVTGTDGEFRFINVPFNTYHMVVSAPNFASYTHDVDVRSTVPVSVPVTLKLSESTTQVKVEANGGDLVEDQPTFHTDVDRQLFQKVPLETRSSEISSLVTLVTPGVAADSNGLFHGLGDHAQNSFSVDGQPITDQQSKVFSNQIPADSVQSLEVISGAPPAEFGEKTSLVIKVTTRSGLGVDKPTGSVTASYGSFGTSAAGFDLAFGRQKWGNFLAANGLNTGRFLDPPEFSVMHAKGNEQNVFDRADYQVSQADTLQLNVLYTRSWFETPNSYDNLNLGVLNPITGAPVGPTDQRSKIETYNIAPSWTRLLSPQMAFNFGAYVRHDQYNYYPSPDPFADLGPADLQSETVAQRRTLLNAGARATVSYVRGMHNFKAGLQYQQTFLTENDSLGIVSPTLNSPCLDSSGNPLPGFTNPTQCGPAGDQPNPGFNPILLPFDLTRAGTDFLFHGHTDVKVLSMYVEDILTKGGWAFNLGIRGDLYNGLSTASQAQPRIGIAYNIKSSNTVLRVSYARTLETPFNENLVISSTGCAFPVIAALVPCVPAALTPGFRNEFHAGLQQAFGKYLVLDGEYIWKYTHNGYDFSVLGATPIAFPIEWHNSKIPGWALRVSVPNLHGFTALVVMSSVAARFFPPQIGGLGVTVGQTGSVFRIDHDERFNQTMHLQYQPWQRGPWIAFNWRYDSGLVAGSVPCFGVEPQNNCPQSTTLNGQPAILMQNASGSPLTADQQFQAGLFCGPIRATPITPLPSPCLASQLGSTLVRVPAPNTQSDDHNPARIAPRNLFDVAVGHDNLFHGDRYRWSLRLMAINLTDRKALYNFLSTFSGTHYVTPRALSAELGFHF